ncbi:MAG: hypothetical protein JWQ71_3922 [Pedosphaera sp.]|nr:hypothetical protein [Pedosphaera sp.]
MKNSIVVLSVVITLLCGFLLFQKNREVEAARARIAAIEQKRAAMAAQASQQEQKNRSLRTELLGTRVEAQELRRELIKPTDTNQPKGVSEIFREQAMKEVLKDEAKAGIARNVKALLDSGLAQQLKLDDNQTASLKKLLTQKGSIFWEQFLVPMMTGEVDEATMPEAGRVVRQALEENTAQLRALLGDDGYETYQRYEKTQPDREQVKNLGPKFAEAGQSLSAEQQSQLLAVMAEERANFKFQYDLADPLKLNFDRWYDNFTEERINAYSQDAEQLNEQIFQRANAVLTLEQAALFKKLLTQQLQQSKLTMRMTTATFAKQR